MIVQNQYANAQVLESPPRIRLNSDILTIALIMLHVPLAFLVRSSPLISTAHGLATFALGFYWAFAKKSPERILLIAAYITDAEVLWRMTNAQIFWEAGKYFLVFLFVITMISTRKTTIPILPLFYFLFLLPSIFLTLASMSLADARGLISFNLSGPLALFVGAVFCSGITISLDQIPRLLMAFIAPVVSITTLATYSTLTAQHIAWEVSNSATSGGYGPNQVSAILGLAVLAIWMLILYFPVKPVVRTLLAALGFWFLGQALLTFSRGGLYNAAIPLILLTGIQFFRPGKLVNTLLIFGVSLTLLLVIVLPELQTFTSGGLKLDLLALISPTVTSSCRQTCRHFRKTLY